MRFAYESEDWQYLSRSDVLRSLCRGKVVIHVGCVDHQISTIKKKLRRNTWLHKTLCDSARRCRGVDTQQEGIRYIRETLGYQDVGVVDIAGGEDPALLEESWDYMVIADVLEHNENPVLFLEQIRAKFKANVRELILTVPNAFSSRNFAKAKKGVEPINSDHCYWFTPYTLCKVVTKAGFRIQKLTMCKHGTVKTRRFFNNYYLRKHPLLRNNIAMVAGFTG